MCVEGLSSFFGVSLPGSFTVPVGCEHDAHAFQFGLTTAPHFKQFANPVIAISSPLLGNFGGNKKFPG
jgi:hypothetical protein